MSDEFDAPAWHDRPTGPGVWVCAPDGRVFLNFHVRLLTVEDLAGGAPFYAPRVYGPIPEDKRDGE